jgi:hypothetical protein
MKKLSEEERKERKRLRNKKYREDNKIKISEDKKKYRKDNKKSISKRRKKYREENKDAIKEYYNTYKDIRNLKSRERYSNDTLYKLTKNIRTAISNSFSKGGYSKNCRTYEILGCTYEEFKIHIESQWEEWMNWDNYGKYNGEERYGWDIDHVIPLASAINESHLIELNHHINLQPLCSYINRDVKKDNI